MTQSVGICLTPTLLPRAPQLSSQSVLTSEWVHGVSIDKVAGLTQEVRDDVGSRLLQLTLRELFDWRFMQVWGWRAVVVTVSWCIVVLFAGCGT
jgi:hypothetical protein